MDQSNREFAIECIRSNTDRHLVATFPTNRPRLYHEGKYIGLRYFLCEQVHGAPPTKAHLPYVTCDNPDCYNPNHLAWMTAGAASHRGQRIGKRVIADETVISGEGDE